MVEGKSEVIGISAGADLSALQYKIISVAGTLATDGNDALGVLQNKPQSGEDASVAYTGHMKAYAGGTIAAGDRVSCSASGTLVTVNSGDSAAIMGKSLSAASSGGLVEFVGNFAVGYTASVTT